MSDYPDYHDEIDGNVLWLVNLIRYGFTPDPGTSDLDDEQPIHVSITLGDYRRAVRLYYELRKE